MDISDWERRNERLLECYVGSNYGYYSKKWHGESWERSFTSWNWAAFFFGSEWMLYRKMYGMAIGLVLIRMALAFFLPYLYWLSSLVIGICVAIYGNSWYYKKAMAEADRARREDPMRAEEILQKRGGTNIAIVLIIEIASLILQFV